MRGGRTWWRGRRLLLVGTVGSLALASLSGCTWRHEKADRPAAIVRPPAQEVWRVPVSPVGQPRTARGLTAVFAVSPGGDLRLTVIDSTSGRVRWTAPASPGVYGSGERLVPLLMWDDTTTYLAYLEPHRAKGSERDVSDGIRSRVVIADARTGRARARSAVDLYAGAPTLCDALDGVCTQVIDDQGVQRPFRLGLPGEKNLSAKAPSAPGGSVTVDSGGYVIVSGRVPSLSRRAGDKISWTLPLATIFGGRVDPDYLSVRQWDSTHDVMVLSLVRQLKDGTHDMSAVLTTAAVDAKGRVLWRAPGTLTSCLGFSHMMDGSTDAPAPATSPSPATAANAGGRTGPSPSAGRGAGPTPTTSPLRAARVDPWMRCRYRASSVRVDDGWPDLRGAATPVVSMEGFDPLTGRTTWRWQVGRAKDLALFEQWQRPAKVAGPTSFVVGAGPAAQVLDVRTGRHVPARQDGPYVCLRRLEFHYAEPRWYEQDSTERDGGLLATPCTLDGSPSERLPEFATLAAFGASTGGTVVLSAGASVVGYR